MLTPLTQWGPFTKIFSRETMIFYMNLHASCLYTVVMACSCVLFGITEQEVAIAEKLWMEADDYSSSARIEVLDKYHMYGRGIQDILTTNEEKAEPIPALKRKADAGDANACFYLGVLYDVFSLGNPRDYLEKAAQVGHSRALLYLGELIMDSDEAKAVEYLHRAAEAGESDAYALLSFIYFLQAESDKSLWEKAKTYLEKAETSGSARAHYVRAWTYISGIDSEPDDERYRECLRAGAEKGDAWTQTYYANYLIKKPGKTQEGIRWMRMAAIGAQKRAQYAMGCIYLTGDFGVKKDFVKGLAFLCRAAYRGEPDAQFKLALCFLRGIGVNPDSELAMGWLQRAAQQGQKDAIHMLNTMKIVPSN